MNTLTLTPELAQQIHDLYAEMQAVYDEVAGRLNFSCQGCPDNCCDSYFQHHTYVEWCYLWEGLNGLPAEALHRIVERAEACVRQTEAELSAGVRPQIMCPLNADGLCSLYSHRLMICRLHGVPATLRRPDGNSLRFPGCFRCQELVKDAAATSSLDRTELYRRLAGLEIALLGSRRQNAPRVKLTLAQMIIAGPPRLG
jgi:hypothetical protein